MIMEDRRMALKLLYTFGIAFVGGFIGIKLKIPAGALLGAMAAVAIYNIYSSQAYIPSNIKIAAQIIIGGTIGLGFTMETVNGLKSLILPTFILAGGLAVFCSILGIIIHKTTGMDLMTALFSSTPGGLTNITTVAEAYGADIAIVGLLATIRVVTVVTIFPLLFKFLSRFAE